MLDVNERTAPVSVLIPPEPELADDVGGRPVHETAAFWAVVGLAVLMTLWRLDRNGIGNPYYAAVARSGSASWHAFWYGSFDPAGFITLDKAPLGFWLPALIVRFAGMGTWSLLAPQAICCIATVAVINHLVRRRFGWVAGAIAGVILALTPAFVITARFNGPDAFFVLLLALAAWAAILAIELDTRRHIVVCAIFLSLAFTTKMLEAAVVLPGFLLAYFVAGNGDWARKVLRLMLGALVLGAGCAMWLFLVNRIAPDNRPFISGSADNSSWGLVTGHFDGGPLYAGDRSATRLFNLEVGSQIAWLIPLAVTGVVAVIAARWRRPSDDPARANALLWAGWLVGYGVAFSAAPGVVQPYFTAAMAPAIAALSAIAIVVIGRRLDRWPWRLLGVAATLGATASAIGLAHRTPDWNAWLRPAAMIMAFVVVALLAADASRAATLGVAVFAATLCPMLWSASALLHPADPINPIAGPNRVVTAPVVVEKQLVSYIEGARGDARFLLATIGMAAAAPIIVDTGEPVMAMGGFRGDDDVPTLDALRIMIDSGEVRFVLTDNTPAAAAGGRWAAVLQERCIVVAPAAYGSMLAAPELWRCAPKV
jgi:4-amino-4-deoxy-L-arabinose transferase-like glycosyltransferase